MNLRVFNALRKLANTGQPGPTPQQPTQPRQQATHSNGSLPPASVAPNAAPTKQGSTAPVQKVDPRRLSVAALGGATGRLGADPKIRQQIIELIKRRRGQQ